MHIDEAIIIECSEEKRSPMMVQWELTEKGKDTMPILMQLTAFGSKWYSDIVFEDKKPRMLRDIPSTNSKRNN